MEAQDFFWASEGLRLIGRAQCNLKASVAAEKTWEELYRLNPLEPEANQRLGTIYQRPSELDASDQALQRVVTGTRIERAERAEAYALIARNIKERWRQACRQLSGGAVINAALGSPYLLKAYETYQQGFRENLDSFYAALNALSLLSITLELAKKLPDVWGDRFKTQPPKRS